MNKVTKKIKMVKSNPYNDWVIEDLKTVAQQYDIDYRQSGTSHVTFRTKKGTKLTVPAHKPIKAIYIKKFIELLEDI
jgi:hypothetical protein